LNDDDKIVSTNIITTASRDSFDFLPAEIENRTASRPYKLTHSG